MSAGSGGGGVSSRRLPRRERVAPNGQDGGRKRGLRRNGAGLDAVLRQQSCRAGVVDRRHQDPVEIARRAAHLVGRQFAIPLRRAGQPRELLPRPGERPGQDEPLLGAGERHIEHPQLLREHRPLDRQPQRLHRHGGKLRLQFGVAAHAGKAQLGVQQGRAVQILTVELLGAVAEEDDGEFQPLRAVDAHDPHDVRLLRQTRRGREVASPLDQPVDEPDEPRKPPVAARVVVAGVLHEQQQVRAAGSAHPHDLRLGKAAALVVDAADDRVGGRAAANRRSRASVPQNSRQCASPSPARLCTAV